LFSDLKIKNFMRKPGKIGNQKEINKEGEQEFISIRIFRD